MKWASLFIFFITFKSQAFLKIDEKKMAQFWLLNTQNKRTPVTSIFETNALLAIISISQGCPMVQKSYIKYERLYKKWKNNKVKFIYLDSSPSFDFNKTRMELGEFNTSIPIFFDENQEFTKELGFETTNQLALFDIKKSELLYLGAIDSSINYYTQKTDYQNYTDSALTSYFLQQKIKPEKTEAFGCAITFKKKFDKSAIMKQ